MNLDASGLSIIHAILAMGLLTFVMMVCMSVTRVITMRRIGLVFQDAAHTEEFRPRLPSTIRRISDNYNHLTEAPTVFYAVSIAIILAGVADPIHAICAWLFFGLRALHSLVQATFNSVRVRANLYVLSWIALAVMIVRALLAAR